MWLTFLKFPVGKHDLYGDNISVQALNGKIDIYWNRNLLKLDNVKYIMQYNVMRVRIINFQ